jgi:hypothetical protein
MTLRWVALLQLCCGVLACGGESKGTSPKPGPSAVAPAGSAAAGQSEPTETASERRGDHYDLVQNAALCEVEHRGRLLDLGTDAASIWNAFQVAPHAGDENVTRDGATLLRARSRELSYDFWLDEHAETLDLSVRVRGLQAKWLYVDIDDRRAASLKLSDEALKVIALPTFRQALEPGRHRIRLRFPRAPKNSPKPHAELDWVRIGGKDDPPSRYAAPTLADVINDVALANTPRRSFVLRGGSTLRCFLKPSPDAKLSLSVGFWGAGSGVAAVRVLRDAGPPVTLQTRRVTGGDAANWTPLELELGDYQADVIGLELSALDATRGGRIAFGDPSIVRKPQAPPVPALARTVVMVVLSSVDRSHLPPWAPTGQLTALAELGRSSVVFSQYRAPTTIVQGALATLLTGLPPRAHRLESPADRLPAGVRTVQRIVKEASGRAAMFTSVPSSFAAFGFDGSWEVYESFSPVSDLGVIEPFLRAARWLEHELDGNAQGPRFVLIHARGAHPPWDVSREEAQQLKPPEYSGAIDPRRSAIVLGALRARTRRNVRRLTDDDWVRMRELLEASLAKQDEGLRKVMSVLGAKNALDSSLVLVVGDVAPVAAPELPYDPQGALTEDRLAVPLLARFPGRALAGKEINAAANASDLPVTILAALGLRAEGMSGMDLFDRAGGRSELTGAAQVATLPGRYATRLGPWLLRGALGELPTLCALDVDPACSRDVFAAHSIAARATWLATHSAEVRAGVAADRWQRTPAVIDKDTAAALAVWGDVPP